VNEALIYVKGRPTSEAWIGPDGRIWVPAAPYEEMGRTFTHTRLLPCPGPQLVRYGRLDDLL
jgi:hypothetical protein